MDQCSETAVSHCEKNEEDLKLRPTITVTYSNETSGTFDVLKKMKSGDVQKFKGLVELLNQTTDKLHSFLPFMNTQNGSLNIQIATFNSRSERVENARVRCCAEEMTVSDDAVKDEAEVSIHRNTENGQVSEEKFYEDTILAGNVAVSNDDENNNWEKPTQCFEEISEQDIVITSSCSRSLPGIKPKMQGEDLPIDAYSIDLRQESMIGQHREVTQATLTPTVGDFGDGQWFEKLHPLTVEMVQYLAQSTLDETAFVDELGSGRFGRVSLIRCPSTGKLLADKVIKSAHGLENVKYEYEIMQDLQHHNIVHVLGCYFGEDYCHIFMEWMPGGSLKRMQELKPFGSGLVINYSYQLLQGIAYMHDKAIVHRDLKGANILISSRGELKIADFGLARRLINSVFVDEMPEGTYLFSAPEYMRTAEFSKSCDIWSFGGVVIEMTTGRSPWPEWESRSNFSLLYAIGSVESPPALPKELSPPLKDLVSQCFHLDSAARPSARQLLNHDVFSIMRGYSCSFQVTEECNISDVSAVMASMTT